MTFVVLCKSLMINITLRNMHVLSAFKCGFTELRKTSTCDTSDCTRPQPDESFISITSDESFIAVCPDDFQGPQTPDKQVTMLVEC